MNDYSVRLKYLDIHLNYHCERHKGIHELPLQGLYFSVPYN